MADNLFKKLEAEALLDREHVVSVVVRFYRTIISYLKKCADRFCNEARNIKYLMLKEKFLYEDFKEVYTYFFHKTKSLPIFVISDNDIFDCYCFIKICLDINLENWEAESVPILLRWKTVLEGINNVNTVVKPQLLEMLGAFVFTVPGTNAECERLFSLVGQYWTKDKSQLKVSTLESVMKVKNKIALTCDQF